MFILYEFLHFLKTKIYQSGKLQTRALKMAKMAFLELLASQKLTSRKIWVTEKCWDFHTVAFTNQQSVEIKELSKQIDFT